MLKEGADKNASHRSQFLAAALGSLGTAGQRRFRGALLLSGTPFDRDLRQLSRQFGIFARKNNSTAPHLRIEDLAERRRQGAGWEEIHDGLVPFMVRRVQQLPVGGKLLSRNQYRVEHRADAGISLKGDDSRHVIRQRLFSALMQKRLIDHLGNEQGGRFPLAMFASWEAYTAPKKPAKVCDGGSDDTTGEALDVDQRGNATKESKAVDSGLVQLLVSSYKERFNGQHPPHPKLENEAMRLGTEAFGEGHKQLIFVRRLASIGDLYGLLNRQYNERIADYLGAQGLLASEAWLAEAERFAKVRAKAAVSEAGDTVLTTTNPATKDDGEELPAAKDTLFSWFFRGKLDEAGKRFAEKHGLPEPGLLRKRLRHPDDWECVIGELDWRGYLLQRAGLAIEISVAELAAAASAIPGSDDKVD